MPCLCPALASAGSICIMSPRRHEPRPSRTKLGTAHRIGWLALLCTVAPILTACAPPASEGGLNSDNPASRLYAIRAAGERRDRAALPALVESLDSDDPAIRMMAISALERITGTRRGYDPYASAAERQPAVDAWVQSVRTSATPPARPASAERS